VKSLSGSDPITARDLYGKPITFRPQATLWVATNHRPKAPSDDDALWERIRELPFTATIPEDERDPDVRAQLRDPSRHGAAILAWAVEGCRLWQAEGLRQPVAVRKATLEYRNEMDPLRGFLADCCALVPAAWTLSASLRSEYERWARQNGEEMIDAARFHDGLRQHGCQPHRRELGRGWRGIRLVPKKEGMTA
jgi:putative DNA primase/helicase